MKKQLFTIDHKIYDGGDQMIWTQTVVSASDKQTAFIKFNEQVDNKYDEPCTLENVKELVILEL